MKRDAAGSELKTQKSLNNLALPPWKDQDQVARMKSLSVTAQLKEDQHT